VNAEAEQLKTRYPAIAAFAGAGAATAAASVEDDLGDFSLDDLSLDEPVAEAPAATVGDDLDDAFDLSLDELEADLESDLQHAKTDEAPLSLDNDLDFGLIDEPAAAAADDDWVMTRWSCLSRPMISLNSVSTWASRLQWPATKVMISC
jgi:pilus assembly protein FimV